MPKLSELKGQNERLSGGILFNFDVQLKNIPLEDEQRLYVELQKIFSQQLSAVEKLLPSGVYLGLLEMEDIDTFVEDDYDRLGSINCDL
jgi:hypothetical protein